MLKQLRRVIFWSHLAAGTVAGIVILIMSVTGVLLTFERQVSYWADTRAYHVAPSTPGAARLSLETLLGKMRETGSPVPTSVTVRAGADAPVAFGYAGGRSIYVNPYNAEVLGEGAPRVRAFFRAVTDWHRWLGAQGESRAVARAVTGASNLAFLLLVTSGFYLWWPRRWNWKRVRNVVWFRRGLPGKARDFNWHNVVGVWSVVPLFIIVLSGVVISYTWAGNLVYRVVGETPPAPRGGGGAPPNAAGNAAAPSRDAAASTAGLDRLFERAAAQSPNWRSISVQMPTTNDAPVTFSIDEGTGGQPQHRAQLTLQRTTGEVVRWEGSRRTRLGGRRGARSDRPRARVATLPRMAQATQEQRDG